MAQELALLVRIAVFNGPNLNLLGQREPDIYGTSTLADIERMVRAAAADHSVDIEWFQTNSEGSFVEAVQRAAGHTNGAIVNAAAFTHTSVAIRDALLAVGFPFVEAHLSNIFAREEMRRRSLLADVAVGVVTGFGPQSYELALRGLLAHLDTLES